MFYRKIIAIVTILLSTQLLASTCENPAVAEDSLGKKFRYGCFCGDNHPNIKHSSKKSYKKLNRDQRATLINQYKLIDAYDDIDAVCKEHDICYIYYGKEAQECNDEIVDALDRIEDIFDNRDDLHSKQCKNLAYDISSVFNTIFSPSDDEDSMFEFGMLMMNGAMVATNKILQESMDSISDDEDYRYPLAHKKCLVE